MRMELVIRFDYGASIPSVRNTADGIHAIAGSNEVLVHTPVQTDGDDLKTVACFAISKGETLPFILMRNDSHLPLLPVEDPLRLLDDTTIFWRKWISRCTYKGSFHKQVIRSLITLKALIYSPTAAIVAAPTTSLPEHLGGISIGTIAIAGCAMRASLTMLCWSPAIRRRLSLGGLGSHSWLGDRFKNYRPCMG